MIKLLENLNNNPVYIKEMKVRKRLNSRRKVKIPSWAGYLAILTLPAIIYVLENGFYIKVVDLRDISIATLFIQVIYFMYRAASASWGLISGEKEMKTYGNLISTGMSADEIVKGKFWSAFYPPARELTFFFPIFVISGTLLKIRMFLLLQAYLLTMLFTLFSAILGIYFSSRERNSTDARNNTVRTIVFLTIGVLIMSPIVVYLQYMLYSSVGAEAGVVFFLVPIVFLCTLSPFSSVALLGVLMRAPSVEGSAGCMAYVFMIYTFMIYTIASKALYRKAVIRVGEIPRYKKSSRRMTDMNNRHKLKKGGPIDASLPGQT